MFSDGLSRVQVVFNPMHSVPPFGNMDMSHWSSDIQSTEHSFGTLCVRSEHIFMSCAATIVTNDTFDNTYSTGVLLEALAVGVIGRTIVVGVRTDKVVHSMTVCGKVMGKCPRTVHILIPLESLRILWRLRQPVSPAEDALPATDI